MAYGAMVGAAIAVVTYSIPAIMNGSWNWKGLGTSMLYGAITGAISGGISAAGTQMAGAFWQSTTMNMLSGVISQVGTSVAMGDQVTWGMVAAGAVTGYIGGKMNNWTASKGGWLANASGELLYNSGKGAILGSVHGTVAAAIDGKDIGDGMKNGMINGAFGAASQTFAMITVFGATYQPSAEKLEQVKKMSAQTNTPYEKVNWRSGGLYQLVQPYAAKYIGGLFNPANFNYPVGDFRREVTWGNSVSTFGNNGSLTSAATFGHEFGHIIQVCIQGWAAFQGRGIYEQLFMPGDAYLTPGTNEYGAEQLRKIYGK